MRAGIRKANLMSLVASAYRQDVDVLAYLESIITHLLRGTAKVADLLPDVWKIHHPESVWTYRTVERRYKADTAVPESASPLSALQTPQADIGDRLMFAWRLRRYHKNLSLRAPADASAAVGSVGGRS